MDENPIIAAVQQFQAQGRAVAGMSFDSMVKPAAFYVVFEDGTESALIGLDAFTREQRVRLMSSAKAFLDVLELP